jgi:hypothetical protein
MGRTQGSTGAAVWRRAFATVSAVAGLLAIAPVAHASVTPPTATITVTAGGTASEAKTVGVPAHPREADIELAIDTTGSMGPAIAQAQADATAIVNGVQTMFPSAQFAVVQFKDAGDTPEYNVEQPMTASASLIDSAIAGLSAGGGGDAPEAYNLVYHNSFTPDVGGDIGWRPGSRTFVVVIGDAEPHGAGTAGIAGCNDTTADPNGLNTATELAGMSAAQRTLFMILEMDPDTSATLPCYQSLAAGAFSGGQGVVGGTDLATQIVNLIQSATATVSTVGMQVNSASPAPASASWISFSPASAGPVNPPANLPFTVNISVPTATPAGTYQFDLEAVADGADIGHQALTVVVTPPGGPPGIGVDHYKCYRARQRDFPFHPRPVFVSGPLGAQRVLVVRPDRLCTPVHKNGSPVRHPRAHLTCYTVRGHGPHIRQVFALDQFGGHRLRLTRTERLCLPTAKSFSRHALGHVPADVDHFQCVRARQVGHRFHPRWVFLRDQFGHERVLVIRPEELCVPVHKNHSLVRHPKANLTCYLVRGRHRSDDDDHGRFRRRVYTRDQFGIHRYLVTATKTLCLPSRLHRG